MSVRFQCGTLLDRVQRLRWPRFCCAAEQNERLSPFSNSEALRVFRPRRGVLGVPRKPLQGECFAVMTVLLYRVWGLLHALFLLPS